MSKCIFCGKGQSEEHIISQWIIKECGFDQERFIYGFGQENQEGELDRVNDPIRARRFCTRNICAECNNGWMSRLENSVKPVLTPFIQQAWPSNAHELLQRVFVPSPTIAKWLLKTACTFGDKMSVEVPADIRKDLYEERITVGIFVDFAHLQKSALAMSMSRQWNVYKDGKLGVMDAGKRSFRLTWQIRHFVMRLSYFPQCELNMERPRSSVSVYPKLRVYDDYQEEGRLKRSYSYMDLQQFEHETIYYHHGFDDPTHPNSWNKRRLAMRRNLS